ncbi:asparaginase [Streptosporangiaceae bacterium NEAU-GS5]|nr:asparaginase [Streptosporangiaceae bacterium NEAU-GS5]
MSDLVVEVRRSGFVESVHRARVYAVDPQGIPVMVHGDVAAPASPRSSVKPLQALGMLRAGLGLADELLALACASHAGEDFHVEGVRKILGSAGLDESALRCPEDYPFDRAARTTKSRLFMNCSGKHAAMVATCVQNGWPVETYLEPMHPLQKALRATVEEFTGERVAATGVDGCGAPLFFVSLVGMVRAFHKLMLGAPGSPERQVADAMRAYPEWTSGTGQAPATLMRAIPGLLNKLGAEAFDVVAYGDGRAAAVKVLDGGDRARLPATIAALRALGLDAPELIALSSVPLYGGERIVGAIEVPTTT